MEFNIIVKRGHLRKEIFNAMTVLCYVSPGCASCRKAKRWMTDCHIPFIERNIFSTRLSTSEIRYLLERCENGTDDIISTRSKAYKKLDKDLEDMTISEMVTFIQENPSVLKRPIMLSEHSMIVGYDDDEITTMRPEADRSMDTLEGWLSPIPEAASADINIPA